MRDEDMSWQGGAPSDDRDDPAVDAAPGSTASGGPETGTEDAGDGLGDEDAQDEELRRFVPDLHKGRKALLDLLTIVAFGAVVATLLGHVGIGISLGIAELTYILAGTAVLLTGMSFLHNSIPWQRYRKARIIHRSRADFVLTAVSILTAITIIGMSMVEIVALLVFVGTIEDVGEAGVRFAGNFVLFQAIILLGYLLILLSRQQYPSQYDPRHGLQVFSRVLVPFAIFFILLGAVFATNIPQQNGWFWYIEVHQAVYIVTLGILLDFIAVTIRLRLPSVLSQIQKAIKTAKEADPAMRKVLQKRAMRTYVIAIVFVAASMAFAGAIATGNIAFQSTRMSLALYIFYGGMSLIIGALVVVRLYQVASIKRKAQRLVGLGGLEDLVQQRRRSPEESFRLAVYGVTGMMAVLFAALAFLTALDRMPWDGRFATDWFLLVLLFSAGPFGYFYNKEFKRIEAIDEKFPDFLRDLAESSRAGMTLPRALVAASKGTYGALTPDIKQMAAQVEWGVAFSEALERFAQRTNTPLVNRTVSLVVEAQRAGGNVVDILTAASDDAREIKQIVSERNEQMKMYSVVIYIAFFVFIAVVLILSNQFIPAFKDAVSAAGGGGQAVGGIQFKEFEVEDFEEVFFHAAIVQAIGGGLVGGVLTRGNPVAGFNAIGVMIVVSWVCFRLLLGVL